MYICMYSVTNYTGTIIKGPSNVTYLANLTPLPIELTCNVTGVAIWRVNGTSYTLNSLANETLSGHSRTGPNILINIPVNNTEYICVSTTNDGDETSDPAYIIIAGEYICTQVCDSIKLLQHLYTHTCETLQKSLHYIHECLQIVHDTLCIAHRCIKEIEISDVLINNSRSLQAVYEPNCKCL